MVGLANYWEWPPEVNSTKTVKRFLGGRDVNLKLAALFSRSTLLPRTTKGKLSGSLGEAWIKNSSLLKLKRKMSCVRVTPLVYGAPSTTVGPIKDPSLAISTSLVAWILHSWVYTTLSSAEQGWASNFGRSLLDLDIFRDRVVLEYLTIEYPTRHFADALDRSSFTRFHLIFRVKWKSRVKLDFTRYY